MDQNIFQTVFTFLQEKTKCSTLNGDTDLMKSGLVNSLFALEIVMFVEKTFHIKLGRKDITAENFRTVNQIAALVERVSSAKGGK